MSHFSVLVIGDNPEDQLAPYHEFETDGDDVFVEDIDITDEIIKAYVEKHGDPFPLTLRTRLLLLDFWKEYSCNDNTAIIYGDAAPNYDSDHKWGYARVVDDKITFIRRTNPNAKWDWYVSGGRFSNHLLLKNGEQVDTARKGDVDFQKMTEQALNDARTLYDDVHKFISQYPPLRPCKDFAAGTTNSDEAMRRYRDQPAIKALLENEHYRYKIMFDNNILFSTREDYAKKYMYRAIATFAVVKDGEWHEQGKMGWWAIVTDEIDSETWLAEYNKLLANLPDDTLLSVYDCHI